MSGGKDGHHMAPQTREVPTRQGPRTHFVEYPFRDMYAVRKANDVAGYHYFEEGTLRFFRSRIGETLYGGRYFTTSEKGPDEVRRYSVREAVPDGACETVGEFGDYATSAAAVRVARELGGRPWSVYLHDTIRDYTTSVVPFTVDECLAWFTDYTGGHGFNRDDVLTVLKQLVAELHLRSYVRGTDLVEVYVRAEHPEDADPDPAHGIGVRE